MALIDTSMYRYENPGYLDSILKGQQAARQRTQFRQESQAAEDKRQQDMQAQQRQQAFKQNLTGLLGSYGEYAQTPQGQQQLFTDMSKAGFGTEMMGLLGGIPQAPKPVQQPPKQFHAFGDQAVAFDPGTGKAEALQGITKPPKPAEPTKYQMVKNRKGIFEAIDPMTGLNKQGKPVEAWIDPKSPKPDGLKPEQVFAQEQQLRSQFLGQTKDFRAVRDAFGRIKVSGKDPSAAGDLALIFNYMKMLDPGSTVREGEFATAAASGSLGDRFVAAGKKLMSGERLDPSQRADFLARAKSLYDQQQRQNDKARFETRKMAQQYPGLNPDRILMDADLADDAPEAQAVPTYQDYDTLPSGAEFTDPEGNVRRKP